jgi:hypothetical protein
MEEVEDEPLFADHVAGPDIADSPARAQLSCHFRTRHRQLRPLMWCSMCRW